MDLKLARDRVTLLVVDVQEKLARVMEPGALAHVKRYVPALLEGARRLGIPVVVTEQYPQGLGLTIPEVRALVPEGAAVVEKLEFSCGAVPAVVEALGAGGRKQVIVVGLETHVCVYLTARDLAAMGFSVFVPRDAVASRLEENRLAGLAQAERAGAVITTAETALFELLERAGTPDFAAVSALLR